MAWFLVYILIALSLVAGYRGGNIVQEPSEGIFDRSFGRERAILESENKFSQIDSAYEHVLNSAGTAQNRQPLLDTIDENEKYGNDGGLARQISQGIVGGAQGLSNIANNIIDAPFDKANELSKIATQRLNNLGAYLVGL